MPLNILMLMLNDNAEHHDLALAFGVRDQWGNTSGRVRLLSGSRQELPARLSAQSAAW
eukprot:CAMPEP_0203934680 /NCGR_PEP_ID=MMETSP0359-20131031/72593_1 /ASSEMBLY_ACC=CAM_ASM_000338 /TAXON_ID=268821 /ORGANISM="Scrippsiella Hangoei, Strain SHTV-5" /LENGTH=57 /DNA_ID=CAMNT_0050864419 /DNA_START=186 /DNA_END=357 /DNA_ORIENTATION=-